MNELIKELLSVVPFTEGGEDSFAIEEDGYKIVCNASENKVNLSIEKCKPDFYNYLDTLDDDLFREVCECYSDKFGGNFKEFDEKVSKGNAEKEIAQFKQCVKEVALKKIEKLNQYV